MHTLRPYQRLIVQKLIDAMSDVNIKHVGITCPTGSGVSAIVAATLDHPSLAKVVGADRHLRNIDVVVFGHHQMTEQLLAHPIAKDKNVFQCSPQTRYADVANNKIPRFWDLSVIMSSATSTPDWAYGNMSITVNPSDCSKLDYTIELKSINGQLFLTETSRI